MMQEVQVNSCHFRGRKIGYALEKFSFSFLKILAVLSLSCCLQLALGSLWLGYFVGFNNGFMLGFVPFIGIEFFKVFFITVYLKSFSEQ
jgi:biotin transporter BioY